MATSSDFVAEEEEDPYLIKILSIDGGGVRGIIPATILDYLEQQLQILENDSNVRVADYFDVIAGTSTGGLIATLLSAPHPKNVKRPLKSAKEILDFYSHDTCGSIFKKKCWPPMVPIFGGPKYGNAGLHEIVKEQVRDLKISETLTNLVLPTFDINYNQPVIFNTGEAKRDPRKNAKLSDVCIGTSAAPTYFPPHWFDIKMDNETNQEYNLVDGGIAANNPTKCAMNYVSEMLYERNQQFYPNYLTELLKDKKDFSLIEPWNYKRFLVLSLGTGEAKKQKYSANNASGWGMMFGWLKNLNGSNPLIDFFMEANSDMVDWNVEVDFKNLGENVVQNYLRIQIDTLEGDVASLDNVKKENLTHLRAIGKSLLDKCVSRVDVKTGVYTPVEEGTTNREALNEFALILTKQLKKVKAGTIKI